MTSTLSPQAAWIPELREALGEVIVGQKDLVDGLILALLTGGHVLLEGVPGIAKSLAVSSLAQGLDGEFARLQFTPDLLPSDLVGSEIYNAAESRFTVRKGPVFANFVLADEINRAPAKVQSALLEAMQERTVSIGGETFDLPSPYLVLATQNPIEQEGTYPLPEAQLDRFMFMVQVGYPNADEEREILKRTTGGGGAEVTSVVSAEELKELQDTIREIPVADAVFDYALGLARATRVRAGDPLPFIRENVSWGAGPRASQFLILGAKAHAALAGRTHVAIEDVRAVAKPVLRHRIVTNFTAQAEGITSDHLIDRLIEEIDPAQAVGAGLPGVRDQSAS